MSQTARSAGKERVMTSRVIASWRGRSVGFVVAIFVMCCVNRGAAGPGGEAGDANARSWYSDNAYIWRGTFGGDDGYGSYLKGLSDREARLVTQRGRRVLIPIDVTAGADHPHVSCVIAGSTDGLPLEPETLQAVDFIELGLCRWRPRLVGDSPSRDRELARSLSTFSATSLALPSDLDDAGMGGYGTEWRLPRSLRHVEITPSQRLSAKAWAAVLAAEKGVVSVGLTGEHVDDRWIDAITRIGHIKGVCLKQCALSRNSARLLGQSRNVTHVALDRCSGMTSDIIQELSRNQQLVELHLALGEVDTADEVVDRIGEVRSLKVLVLDNPLITESQMRKILGLPNLQVVVMLHPGRVEVRPVVLKWANEMESRRAYLFPDPWITGWVRGLEGRWVHDRAVVWP